MASLKQNARRIILMAVTIFSGSALIFLDAPILIVILTTFLVGIIMLILLGIMRVSAPSDKEETSPEEVKTLFKPLGKKGTVAEEPQVASRKSASSSRGDVLRTIPGKMREAIATVATSFSRKGNSIQEKEKIDRMLDKTISEDPFQDEGFPDFPEFDESPKNLPEFDESPEFDELPENDPFGEVESRISEKIEKLSTLSTDDLISLESEIEQKLHGEEEETRLNIDIDDEAFSELPGGEDGDSRLSSSEIEELEGFSGLADFEFEDEGLDAGVSVDLDSLDDLDLEDNDLDIKIDEETDSTPSLMEEEPEELEIVTDEEPTVTVDESPAPAAAAEVKIEGFGLPGDADSNLLDMLHSESKPKESVVDISLVRDLKDTKVTAEELVDELGDVLVFLNKKNP